VYPFFVMFIPIMSPMDEYVLYDASWCVQDIYHTCHL
jgi:hypothetical protein